MIRSEEINKLDKLIHALKTVEHPLNNIMNEYKLFQDLSGNRIDNKTFTYWCENMASEVQMLRSDINEISNILIKLVNHHQTTFNSTYIQDYELYTLRNIQGRGNATSIIISY